MTLSRVLLLALSLIMLGALPGVNDGINESGIFAHPAWAMAIPSVLQGADLLKGTEVEVPLAKAPRGTVVLFLSSRCPCSASHQDRIKELARDYSKDGFQFIAVHSNQDEPEVEAQEHFRTVALPFPVLKDVKAHLANQFGALKTPHAYVLSPKGKILFQGGVDDSHNAPEAKKLFLKVALDQIKAGKDPEPAQVKVLGCAIQR